jgi:hypothetical protein
VNRRTLSATVAILLGTLPVTAPAQAPPGAHDAAVTPTIQGYARAHGFQRPGRVMRANVLLLRYPDDDVTVVVLGNTNVADTDAFGYFIGRAVLP